MHFSTFFGHILHNTSRTRQNGHHFADDIFKCMFLNDNAWIPIEISLKFVPQGPINNIPALYQIMAWRRPGDKPLSGPMMVRLPTHICVTRPQWDSKRVVSTQQFFIIHLSSIQCNPVGKALSYRLRNVSLTLESVFKSLANKDVMSFELSTKMTPGLKGLFRYFVKLFHKAMNKIVFELQSILFHTWYCVKQYSPGIHKFLGKAIPCGYTAICCIRHWA